MQSHPKNARGFTHYFACFADFKGKCLCTRAIGRRPHGEPDNALAQQCFPSLQEETGMALIAHVDAGFFRS
jgi:hypothetical protein